MEEKKKEEYIWSKKISFCGGEENRKRKRRKIFEEGIYLFGGEEKKNGEGKGGKHLEKEHMFLWRRKKQRMENIWRRNIFFCRGEGKGGKYLEKGNIFLKRRRKRRQIIGGGKYHG